jgi:glycosyltransferase involved in cell wall biosynthesis
MSHHILWITPGFAADENDTTCIPALQDLALFAQSDESVGISIIAMHYPFNEQHYCWNGMDVYAAGGKNKKGANRFKTWYNTIRLARKLHRQRKLTAIHSFWISETTLIAQFLCMFYGIKHIQTVMGQDAKGKSILKFILKKRIKWISLSDFSAAMLKKNTGIVSSIIPFGVPEEILTKPVAKTVDLIAVGSIIPLKNHLHFLQLVLLLAERGLKVNAQIIGERHDEEEWDALIYFIEKNKLQAHVSIFSKMDRKMVFEHMERTKILVHVSLFEGQGMVMQEAMAVGCKVFSLGNGIQFKGRQFELLQGSMHHQAGQLADALLANERYNAWLPITISNTWQQYKKLYIEK